MRGLFIKSIFITLMVWGSCFDIQAQLQINTNASAEEMVEEIIGVGVDFYNVSYVGANVAGGLFTFGSSAGLDVEHGIVLSSGNANIIPGPNSSYSAGQDHNLEGDPLLTNVLGVETYDAAVLEFDFIAMHDTLRFNFSFGSEEYNEWVGAPFNDIYGLFVSGPDPVSGFYNDKNFGVINDLQITPADSTFFPADTTYYVADTIIYPADTLIIPPDTIIYPADTLIFPADTVYTPADTLIVPADTSITALPVYINNINNGPSLPGEPSSGPCNFCQHYTDNYNGNLNIEYDGMTNTFTSVVPVVPDAYYHFSIAIADASDGLFDSGVFVEKASFVSLGPADFNSFMFLMEHNEGLDTDVIGEINGTQVLLTVPDGTDVSELVADFVVGGVYVNVEDNSQVSGETLNDFTFPVTYKLEGYNIKNWEVVVQTVSGLNQINFDQVNIGPNPSFGVVKVENVAGLNIKVFDYVGKTAQSYNSINTESITISGLKPGMYFIQLEKDGNKEVRKFIVQ